MISTETSLGLATCLFDDYGRRTAPKLTAAAHSAVRRRFICNQPLIDYAAIHDRITRQFDCPGAISVDVFKHRAETILQELRADERCANLVNAVAVPFFLPQTPQATSRDLGAQLEHVYLPAVGLSFHEAFPNRAFVNHHKASLTGKLAIASGSRHEQLLHSMEAGVVVGYVFISLTEYSIPAAIEQLSELPPHVLLSGGADLSAAIVGSPDLLLRTDGYPPLIWLAALRTEAETAGYHYEAYGYDLNFNRRVHLNQAAEYWASALTVLD